MVATNIQLLTGANTKCYSMMAVCRVLLRSKCAPGVGPIAPRVATRKVGSNWRLARLHFYCGLYSPETRHRSIMDTSDPGPQKYFRRLSPGLQLYLTLIRAHQPIGSWLVFWPFSWSITLATTPGHLPSLSTLALFGAGAFVMRSAGCIINDMLDRDVDAEVRTG